MTIAMWWIVVGVLLLVAGLAWLLGPFGLIVSGALCVVAGLILSPSDRKEG